MRKGTYIFLLIICFTVSCSKNDFLKDYNKQELFAPPSREELNAVRSDWESRDLSPNEYHVEQTVEVTNSGTILKILSFKVGTYKEYGALLIPKSTQPIPVRMFINGFEKGITANTINIAVDTSLHQPSILAIPALRGQSLNVTLNGMSYTTPISEGEHCDAFDGATDDAIALLNIIESTEEIADINRVAVRGGSRGGTVALLMAERDKRVKMAIAVVGPTNMMELTSKNENDATYQCQFLSDLVNGSSTITEIRHNLMASSPIFFAEDLPQTQMHFAANDKIIPIEQGEQLKIKMDELGLQDLFEMYIYEGRGILT